MNPGAPALSTPRLPGPDAGRRCQYAVVGISWLSRRGRRKFVKRMPLAIAAMFIAGSLSASCSREPEVGSSEWCKTEGDSGRAHDYTTMEQISRYAKHCLFKEQKAE